jgi:hypothetical protein
MKRRKAPGPVKPAKHDPNTLLVSDGVDGVSKGMTPSQIMSAVATHAGLSAPTLKAYANIGEYVEVTDLTREMRYAADEVVAGDLNRIERLLSNQFMTLDAIFNRLAQRSIKQEYMKQMETCLRLALKAQGQARATAEAIALIKNPVPYIKQTNIAQGYQQVNNGLAAPSAHAGNSSFAQSKLLGAKNGQTLERMDTRAQAQAGRVDSEMATVG